VTGPATGAVDAASDAVTGVAGHGAQATASDPADVATTVTSTLHG
jgi:hypothetical protein